MKLCNHFKQVGFEERVGLICFLEIRDGLRKKAWPTSITFPSSMCSCVIVQLMIKTGEHLPEMGATPGHFQPRYWIIRPSGKIQR